MEPDSDNQDCGSLGDMLRGVVWTVTTGDEAVSDTAEDEKCADITNVVYGHSYNAMGEIKRANEPVGNEYTYTVAAWQVDDEDESHIYFRVLYRDGTTPETDDHLGAVITVDETADYLKKWPSVTAHINHDEQIVVDIVYMRRHVPDPNPYNWRIYHRRFEQDDPDDFDVFNSIQGPTDISPTDVTQNHVMNPDIVFDAVTDDEDGVNHLHVVAEVTWDYDDRDIWYLRGVGDGSGGIDWLHGDKEDYINNSITGVNSQARIDVGYDDTDYFFYIDIGYALDDDYYVGVVWHHGEYYAGHGGWIYDVYLTLVPANDDLPGAGDYYNEKITDSGLYEYRVMPYIDIEPIENTDNNNARTAMIVWTDTFNSGSGWFWGKLYGTNTYRIADNASPQSLFVPPNGPIRNNGLCTIAIPADTSHTGYLTWLNHDGNNLDVYASEVQWLTTFPFTIAGSLNYFEISYGLSDLGEDDEYNYAPEIAVFDGDEAKAVWTDIENGSEPSIWGDTNDWSD